MLSPQLTIKINKLVFGVFCLVYFAKISTFSTTSQSTSKPETAGGLQGRRTWSRWSDCSKSCGVGIKFSDLKCTVRSQSCMKTLPKRRRKYKVCYEQRCGQKEDDLRSSQCSAFNDIPYKGTIRRWEPVPLKQLSSMKKATCSVSCRDRRNHSLIVELASNVIDGTICDSDTSKMCIKGKCVKLGCDMVVNSPLKFDNCGVCGGNGTGCRLFTGLYSPATRNQNSTSGIVFPQGSANIKITEKGSGHIKLRYLTNSSSDNDLFDWRMISYKHHGYLRSHDLEIKYSSLPSGKSSVEIKTKISKPMQMTITTDSYPLSYIRYEYYKPDKYKWSLSKAEAGCTVNCGRGLMFHRARCMDVELDDITNASYCAEDGLHEPQPYVAPCSLADCDDSLMKVRLNLTFEWMRWYRWQATPWTICTHSCEGGLQTRDVTCVTEEIDGKVLQIMDESKCLLTELKPIAKQECNKIPCPRWVSLFWSKCSVSCGRGTQHRAVRCEDGMGGPAFSCSDDDKPNTERTCTSLCNEHQEKPPQQFTPIHVIPIPSIQEPVKAKPKLKMQAAHLVENVMTLSKEPSWVAGPWSDCSKTCGSNGISTREINCKVFLEFSKQFENIPDSECRNAARPTATQECSMGPCDNESPKAIEILPLDDVGEPTYVKSPIGQQEESLGFAAAYRFRDDEAIMRPTTTITPDGIGEEIDSSIDEPAYQDYKWKYSAYDSCTPSCGFGTRRSYQYCTHIRSQVRVADDRCDPATKSVPIVQQCNDGSCFLAISVNSEGQRTRWEISPYGGCTVGCGRGMQRRSVVCRQMPETQELDVDYMTTSQTLPDIMCPAPKPSDTRACSLAACPPEWVPGPWSECTRYCGRGVQFRHISCMQRLATGETEAVPSDYCSRYRPASKRRCGLVDCEPKLVTKRWSPCSRTCGRGVQTREMMCLQILARHHLLQEVSMRNCAHLPRKPSKKYCKLKKCKAASVPLSDDYEIFTDDDIYVQNDKDDKIKLTVGGQAFVKPGTTVVIQCPVTKTLDKSTIEWLFEGSPITIDEDHISLTPYFNLRVRGFTNSDAGIYTCVAADERADITLQIKSDDNNLDISTYLDNTIDDDEFNDVIGGNKLMGGFGGNDASKSRDAHSSSNIDRTDNHIDNYITGQLSKQALTPKRVLFHQQNPDSHMATRHREKIPHDPSFGRDLSDNLAFGSNHGIIESGFDTFSPQQAIVASDNKITPLLAEIQDPAKELLLFLEMAGIDNPSDEVFEILEKINELEETGQLDDTNRGQTLLDMLNELEMNGNISAEPDDNMEHNNQIFPENSWQPESQNPDNLNEEELLPIIPGLNEVSFDASPKIIVQPTLPPIQLDKDIVLSVGGPLIVSNSDSVTLLCEVTSPSEVMIEWLLNDQSLHETDRLFVLPDHSLRLLQPAQADTGTYTCVASNEHGSDSVSTSLSVSQVPKIISTTEEVVEYDLMKLDVMIGNIIKARLGATVRIFCKTEGHPEPYVQWRKDINGLGPNIRVLPDNSLEIRPTTAADQGLFGCEATNPVGTDYQASALILVDPPHVSDDLRVLPELESQGMGGVPELLMTAEEKIDYRIKAGTSVIMGCPVKGFPEPEVTWTFNDRPLIEVTDLLDYQLMLGGKVLQIPEVDEKTVGVFVCNTTNTGGELLTSLQLKLIEYTYALGTMTSCSATCGGDGVQHRELVCKEDGKTAVDNWYCTGLPTPRLQLIPCNRIDCPARYEADEWGSCSQTCGEGERTRNVRCRIFMANGSSRTVDESLCDAEQNLTLPISREKCQMEKCPFWRPGPWSKCSRKCAARNVGWKTRRLYCVSSSGENLERSECKKTERPTRREMCENSRCTPVWVASRWSSCSKSCGMDGIQTRILNCVYRGNRRQHAGTRCPKSRRPAVTAPCNRISCREGPRVPYIRPTALCKDKSPHCRRAKLAKLCSYYRHLCCESCT